MRVCPELTSINLPFLFTTHERRTCYTSGLGTVIPIAVAVCTVLVIESELVIDSESSRSAGGVGSILPFQPLRRRESHHGRSPSTGDDTHYIIKLLPAVPEIDYETAASLVIG